MKQNAERTHQKSHVYPNRRKMQLYGFGRSSIALYMIPFSPSLVIVLSYSFPLFGYYLHRLDCIKIGSVHYGEANGIIKNEL